MANNVARSVIKSGWLWRRTNVLHRWKQNWFVLWSSGRLMYYEDEKQTNVEDFINIPVEKPQIITGDQLHGQVEPPDAMEPKSLIALKVQGPGEEKTWFMCAESADDACAWRVAFEEAANIVLPAPYSANYQAPQGTSYYYPPQHGGNQNYFIPDYYGPGRHYYLPPNSQIIYVDRRPFYRHPGNGLLYGLALGSMMFWPWMMFPFFC